MGILMVVKAPNLNYSFPGQKVKNLPFWILKTDFRIEISVPKNYKGVSKFGSSIK